MARTKLWFCSCALRATIVLALAELLGFAQSVDVQSEIADSLFCERFAVPYGYNCQQYTTMTADGFLLAAYRISNKPRTTLKSESTTMAEAPTPIPALCVTTADQLFESISEFVRESDTPELSRKAGFTCIPVAPTPLTGNTDPEAGPTPTPTQPLSAGRGEGLEDLGDKHDADTGGPSFHPPVASTAYNFVHASTRRGRIGYVQRLGNSYKRATETIPTGIESSFPFKKGRKGDHGLRSVAPGDPSITVLLSSPDAATTTQPSMAHESSDEVAPLPVSQPVSQVVLEEDEDLTPATPPDSQLPPSPSSSREVSLAERAEAVLLMHHEFQNGKSWFTQVDEDSDQLLPFLLLNAGFDVWVGHQRATYYAHNHITLTPEDLSYWNWTWDEHVKYDMPALLELVKMETRSTVHFVGISQSATVGAAAATMISVSPLLRSLTLIGPTIYRGNTTSRTLTAFGALLGVNLRSNFYNVDHGVFNLTTESNSILSILPPVSALLTDISGPNCCLGSNFKVKFSNGWDGTTSLKNFLHFQQGIRSNTWSHFDYGSVMNNSLAYDGSPLPPIYDPDDIPVTLPVFVIYGGRDNIAPPSGVRQFISHLSASPGSTDSVALLLPEYAHFDLFYSVNRTQDVFIPVLQFLERQRLSYNDTLQPHPVPD